MEFVKCFTLVRFPKFSIIRRLLDWLIASCSRYIHNFHISPVIKHSVVGRPVVIVIPGSKTAEKRIIDFSQAETTFVNEIFNNCSKAGYAFFVLSLIHFKLSVGSIMPVLLRPTYITTKKYS